jgi:predicted protein tyrosine phosphatase
MGGINCVEVDNYVTPSRCIIMLIDKQLELGGRFVQLMIIASVPFTIWASIPSS